VPQGNRDRMKKLTEKQVAILGMITEGYLNGKTPTVYEIADQFKVKTSTVFAHIRALQRKGKLTRTSEARSIEPVGVQRIIGYGPGRQPIGAAVLLAGNGYIDSLIAALKDIGAVRVEISALTLAK